MNTRRKQINTRIAAPALIVLTALPAFAARLPAGHSAFGSHGYAAVEPVVPTHRSRTSWGQVVAAATGPEDICGAVKQRVQYKADRYTGDEWQSGRATWDRREGDCEDIAAAVTTMCREKGMSADIYVLHPRDRRGGHAVAVGTHNGQMWMSSNGAFRQVGSMREVRDKVAESCHWLPQHTAYRKVGISDQGAIGNSTASSQEMSPHGGIRVVGAEKYVW